MLITLNNINIKFKDRTLFKDFSLNIEKGEKLCIKGESGSGKSTLLSIILGIIQANAGNIYFNGNKLSAENIQDFRSNIAWIPQSTHVQFELAKDLFIALSTHIPFEQIEALGLQKNIVDEPFHKLSGGEKQRLLIAGGLGLNRNILIMDEPTAALDSNSKQKVIELTLKKDAYTIISTSHDEEWIKECDKVIELK